MLSDEDPRITVLAHRAPPRKPAYVLYFCQAFRRPVDNLALSFALQRANELGLPCLVYEAIRSDYPFASARFHSFVLEGAAQTARALAARGIAYRFYLPRTRDEARGMVARVAQRAALVVSDDSPTFIAKHNEAAARRVPCSYVVVDDNTPIPLALFPKQEYAARTIRPKVHKLLAPHLIAHREIEPRVAAPRELALPFEPVDFARADIAALVRSCDIDHEVGAVAEFPGGHASAEARLGEFLRHRLRRYATDRNEPSLDVTSHLSPYLHFGMISARRVALAARDAAAGDESAGPSLEGFLEQLLVRRTLAFNFARSNREHASYGALPTWAKATLAAHARDARPALVPRDALERGASPDEVWNAAQHELRTRGIIHNYLRMLWGKLVVTWSKTPEEAHATIVYLNDKWALDGRDPDGYTNIGWCFGLHDRPWPEHPIFGTVRTMTSRSARAKLDLGPYLARAAGRRAPGLFDRLPR